MEYMEHLRENLPSLYNHMQQDMKLFKRETYPDHFAEYQRQHAEVFGIIESLLEEAEDAQEETMRGIAQAFVDCVGALMEQKKGKIARENELLNLSMVTVLYVIPGICEHDAPESRELSERICEAWNENIKGNRIQPSDFASIQGGFRTKMCYITTAVCRSLNKPDDCYELKLLKNYRDGYLCGSEGGAELIHDYYDIAPTIVKRIDKCADAKERYRLIWEQYLSPCVLSIETDKKEECRVRYTDMVRTLQREYMEEYDG